MASDLNTLSKRISSRVTELSLACSSQEELASVCWTDPEIGNVLAEIWAYPMDVRKVLLGEIRRALPVSLPGPLME